MNTLFLVICAASILFFTVFLVACIADSRRRLSKHPVVHKLSTTEAVDSAAGRRWLIYLEQQMAEFLSSQGRSVAALLLAVGLVATSTQMKAQSSAAPASAPSAADEQVSPAVQKQLDAMQRRIEQLEAELNRRNAQAQLTTMADGAPAVHSTAEVGSVAQAPAEGSLQAVAPGKAAKPEPFSFADFSWLNGNSRIKEVPLDTKFFTPEIRADVDYVYDFRHPKDDTIGGSSEIFRANEFQVTQLGVGGDFHWDNVQARVMTQFGMYSTTTPRNDASPARGQWNLADAYRYVSEAYAGYHLNVMDGINIQAGIFMSYVGLFSYYNFDNWAYQPSYVSSNTPWFFNGMRVQIFPNEHLKIEPWLVNGWQAYGRFNNRPGIGAQILWRPNSRLSILGNQYMLGEDALGISKRVRYHTDDSLQYKYYQNPSRFLDMAAFSFTGDLGCEHGGGVSCTGNSAKGPKQSFVGYMFYNRLWFHKDLYGLTIGGARSTIPAATWCYCRLSRAPRRSPVHRTLRRIPAIRTRHGMFPPRWITCRASTSPSAWNTTTVLPTCPTSPDRGESRLPAATRAHWARLCRVGRLIFVIARTG